MRSTFLATVLCAGVAAQAGLGQPLAGQSASWLRDPVGLSGLPGLAYVPIAGSIPSGTADVTIDNALDPRLSGYIGLQRNVFVSIGFLPRLTLTARGTMSRNLVGGGEIRDLSVNAQFLLFEERSRAPALAVGLSDPDTGGETPYFTSYYVTASKTLFGRVRVTGGYGVGSRRRDVWFDGLELGLFGGLELRLGRWATVLGEHYGEHWNGGLRLFPFPDQAERLGVQPRLDVLDRGGIGRTLSAGFRVALGGPKQPLATTWVPEQSGRAPERGDILRRSGETGPTVIASRLVAFGFENVRVGVDERGSESTLTVEYENRVFNRDEWDALGVVMGVVAVHAPITVSQMEITIRRVDVPVMTVTSSIESFRDFVEDRLPGRVFAEELEISNPGHAASGGGGDDARLNRSLGRFDVFVRPRVETMMLTELGVADARVTVLPDVYVQLGRGFVLNARAAVRLGTTHGWVAAIDDPPSHRLLLHKAMRVGRVPRSWNALTQFSMGWFAHDAIGISNEIDVSLGDGRISLGSTFAAFGPELGKIDSGVALGNVRVRYPALDLTASLEAGVFLRGDAGAAGELSRFFGDTEVGFYVRSTTFGSVAGMRLSVPLTPARDMRPTRVRPRLPDVYTHTQQITILEYPSVQKRFVGRLLETDHELKRVYRSRDRLQASNLREHVEVLREAALGRLVR